MHAYILCGGFGTRLRRVLKGTQKAVVDIHGRPFLALVLAQLREAGVNCGVLCCARIIVPINWPSCCLRWRLSPVYHCSWWLRKHPWELVVRY